MIYEAGIGLRGYLNPELARATADRGIGRRNASLMDCMLLLASQSPRRQEILTNAGIPFTVRIPSVEELRRDDEAPAEYVRRLARDKANAVPAGPEDYVLAADTVVVVDGAVLEKPVSAEDAARMLRLLSGRTHHVLTGVCVLHGEDAHCEVASTTVQFTDLSDGEIDAYVESGEPNDKAGAYAIQGLASKYISRIEGCYFNVVGLPISLVWRLLREAGYKPALG